MQHLDGSTEEPIPLDDMACELSPRPSIRRKPLPLDSPYSPPNSPRTSMILPRSPILKTTLLHNPPLLTPPGQLNVALSTETAFIKDESLKTVSLTSTSDPPKLEAPLPPSKSAVDTSYARYTYRSLHPIGYERMSLADDDFPMRPKSFGTFERHGSFGKRMGWMIVVLVMLIITIIVAVLAAVGLSRSMRMQG